MSAEWQTFTVRVRSSDLDALRAAEAASGLPPMQDQTEVEVCVIYGLRRRIENMRKLAHIEEVKP